ncbi:hypothetical protein C7S20_07165 [Christiangramia fulva]|uniref:Uncharacterized protein n=1 Tax=Christiangramia fulva TaxID=2126553 RepID=A0A2R3Z470_9FLAO|nr:hypothetical protein [Christiangramia fulva]AVR45065.1 hypothetical protein C7S20_07165 [Christiangramia fulva]
MSRKSYAIFFLGLMLLMIFPWQGVCSTHLFHPEHHKHAEGLSTCELRRNYTGHKIYFWPPMKCEHHKIIKDSFENPGSQKITISPETLFLGAIILNILVYVPEFNRTVNHPEIIGHNLAPPGVVNPLRGPPNSFSSQKV